MSHIKKLSFITLLFTSLVSSTSYAILDIEITQGVDTAIPVAITDFSVSTDNISNKEGIDAPDLSDLSKVIAADLYRSGLFSAHKQPSSLNNLDLSDLPIEDLHFQEVEYIIRGSIEVNPYNRYQVNFELIDLYQLVDINNIEAEYNSNEPRDSENNNTDEDLNYKDNGRNMNYDNAVLLSKSFSVSKEHLRYLSHHISDLIYERLIGVKGIFSSKIAYVNVLADNNKREYVLEVADSDGFNPQQLLLSSEPMMSPSWHPNGKEIAYVSFMANRSKIKSVDLATGNTRTLTQFKGINGAPSWSPDGSKLALVLSHEKSPKIYLLDVYTNKLTKLTYGSAIDTEPRWSPDGKSLIFTSNRGGGPQIYNYNLKTKKIKRLTYEGNYNARASFTPDGSKLIMIHRAKNEKGFNIAVQDLETFNLDILTGSNLDESPSISANGQQIIYATRDGNKGILAEVSIDGRVKIKRPARHGDVQEPAWSPYLS